MKKVLCLLVVLTMIVGCVSISASAAEYGTVLNNNVALLVGNTTVVANNSLQTLQAAPVAEGEEVLVPLSAVTTLLEGMVNYNEATGLIELRFGMEKYAVLRVGSTQYTLNGRGYELSVAPKVEGGVVMVPLLALAEKVAGQTVFYDKATQLVVISSRRVIKDAASDAVAIATIANAIRTGVLPPISVPTYYEQEWPTNTNSGNAASDDKGQLKFVTVTASAEPEANNGANNINDGNTGTFWAAEGSSTIVGDIGKINNMTEIRIAFAKYTERAANFQLAVSEDNKNYTTIYSGSSTQNQQWDTYKVSGAYRYVRVTVNGTSAGGSWNSLAEVQAYNGGSSDSSSNSNTSSLGNQIDASTFTYQASAVPEMENGPDKVFDNNPGTYWAAENQQFLTIDLGKETAITGLTAYIRQYSGDAAERKVKYGLSYSSDNNSYTSIFSGEGKPGGGVPETYEVNANARYIKIDVNGSDQGTWASFAELMIYTSETTSSGSNAGGSSGGGSITPVSYTATAEPQPENSGRNSFDGNPGTFWAAENSQSITYDLGSAVEVASVDVQMRDYNPDNPQRMINYSVEYSADGSSYTSVFNGAAAAGGGKVENHAVGASARYIRVGVNGSNEGSWASLSEVKINGAGGSGGSVSGYKNMDAVSGEFLLAPYGSTDVLSIASDGSTLTVGSAQQKWTLDGAGIKNVSTGIFVDVFNQSMDEGGQVGAWEGNGGANQQWTFEKDGDGYYVKNAMSGLYLANVGGNVQQRSRGSATKWVVTDGTIVTVSGGASTSSYKNMATVSGQFLLAPFGSTDVLSVASDGASLVVGAAQQKWSLDGAGIKNDSTGTYMDVFNQSMDEGGQVGVWEGNGGANQQWSFENDGNGYYIKNAMSGLYLAYSGGSVQQRSRGSATKWIVTDGTIVTTGGAGTTGYKNMDSVSGEFMIAPVGSTDVLYVASDGASLSVGGDMQKWSLDGSGVRSSSTGAYMDVFNQSMDEGGQVGVWEGNGGANQQWTLEKDGDGYYFQNAMSGLYLAYVGGSVQQRSKGSATKWVITDGTIVTTGGAAAGGAAGANLPDMSAIGEFVLSAADGSILTIDKDGHTVVAGPYTATDDQKWTLDGTAIVNTATGKRLGIHDGSTVLAIKLCVEEKAGIGQNWSFDIFDDGYYIRNNNSGLYVSIVDGLAIQRSLINATRFTPIEVGSAAESALAVTSAYTNLDYISGNFIMVPVGTNNAITVGGDNYAIVNGGAYAGDARQQWTLDGSSIKNVATGTYMDVSNESRDPGAQVGVWEGNGGANQKWAFELDNGAYYVKSTMSNLYVSMASGSAQQTDRAGATRFIVASANPEPQQAETQGTTVPTVSNGYKNLDSINGNFILVPYGTENALNIGSDNYTITTGAYTGDSRQQWALDGSAIKNLGTGLFLDVSGESRDPGAQIGVWEGNGGVNQQWAFEKDNDGYYLKSTMSNLYLGIVGGNVQQVDKSSATKLVVADTSVTGGVVNNPNTVTSVTGPTSKYTNMTSVGGDFIIVQTGTDNVLTVGSNNQSLSVTAYTNNGNQQWTLDGASFKNLGTGLYMDVSGQSHDVGGEIIVWEGNGGENQMWVFEKDGDNGYYIKSMMSGLYLSVVGNAIQQVAKSNATVWIIAAK